jgi:N-acetylmuramic acid 6-phosphate etherase/N-acetylglucosamine-6-phosphate deacetylase
MIWAKKLFINGAFSGPAAVEIRHGHIAAIRRGPPAPGDEILDSGCLAPGLIDLHNNGAFGADFATSTVAEITTCLKKLAARGVTSILPTIITAPLDELAAAAARLKTAAAENPGILGIHLEGPFLAPAKKGAHRADWLLPPTAANLAPLLANPSFSTVKFLTIAPELPGAIAAISRLTAAGIIVSLGHTTADAPTIQSAIAAGASFVTHVFTAQPAITHRGPAAPGLPTLALTDERLTPCLIADTLHVHPALLLLAFRACPRAIAVTDSIRLAGLPPGATAPFGGASAVLGEDGLARRSDGTVAGAAITLDEALRRLITAGVAPETALAACTQRPADALNRPDLGRIVLGARADLVWFSDDFFVQKVWFSGTPPAPAKPRSGTETARPDLADLDEWPSDKIVATFLAQEAAAQRALTAAAPALAALADAVAQKIAAGGRLFYAGAGTSGRLALLDAVECGPTFGIPEGQIIALLAGGDSAFLKAVEGAEDSSSAAPAALQAANVTAADALVAIAASGATPFTLAALNYAASQGALTAAIVNNLSTPLAAAAQHPIVINSGPEIIAGSTRLSAGTTQKIALNILSSTIMIRLHKTFGPHMIDLRPTNAKLIARATKIITTIGNTDETTARAALERCGMHVKTAILTLRLGVEPDQARALLATANGSLRAALATNQNLTAEAEASSS